ncbi:MAG TPA: hypothetical protein VLB45_05550 [Nitrosopumilaceae archaeon]|nr:hypothetical protein [Nitrosopumilaceae archaeon]
MNLIISYLLCTEFKKYRFDDLPVMCEMLEEIQAAQLAAVLARARKQRMESQYVEKPQETIAQ